MKPTLNIIWTVVILVMMNNAVAQEENDTDHNETIWFSTSTSALLNLSSTELATQHINRGIRLAQQAMQEELNDSDQLIANHNLCVGYLSAGETDAAKPYCTRAAEIAQQPLNIVKVRGAYFLSAKMIPGNTLKINSLYQVVLSNIEHQDSNLPLSLAKK